MQQGELLPVQSYTYDLFCREICEHMHGSLLQFIEEDPRTEMYYDKNILCQ